MGFLRPEGGQLPCPAASRNPTRTSARRSPGCRSGVSSNFRYWGEEKTIYASHAKGARLTDIDGNEYIDYRLAYGPCILGLCRCARG